MDNFSPPLRGIGREAATRASRSIIVLLTFGLLILIGVVIWKVYKGSQAAGKVAGDALGDQIISQQTGIPKARLNVVKSVNKLLQNGYHSYWLYTDIDEEAWIVALNQLIAEAEARLVCQYYLEDTGRSLRADLNSAFDQTEKAQVKAVVYNALT
jgi:hypothetical protein